MNVCVTVIKMPFPVLFSRHHLSYGDCLEDKKESDQNCSVLFCKTLMHNNTHTYEQFLKLLF